MSTMLDLCFASLLFQEGTSLARAQIDLSLRYRAAQLVQERSGGGACREGAGGSGPPRICFQSRGF